LLQGDREVVYPILAFCLTRLEDLKKRAYIGKYLVPVDVPQEILIGGQQIGDIHQQV
jgi:intraflagellar transport protein 81